MQKESLLKEENSHKYLGARNKMLAIKTLLIGCSIAAVAYLGYNYLGSDQIGAFKQSFLTEDSALTSLLRRSKDKVRGPFCINHVPSGQRVWHQKDKEYLVLGNVDLTYDVLRSWYYYPSPDKIGYGFIERPNAARLQFDSRYHKSEPSENSYVVTSEQGQNDKRDQYPNLFQIDDEQRRIRHISGLVLTPKSNDANAPSADYLMLNKEFNNDSQEFMVVQCFTNKQLEPNVAEIKGGHWKMIYSILNPLAEQKQKYTTEIGISQTDENSWKVRQQAQVSASFWSVFSTRFSVRNSYSQVSRKTFDKKMQKKVRITAQPGKSVVVWQYVIDGLYSGASIDFNSEIYYHTKSISEKPPSDIIKILP